MSDLSKLKELAKTVDFWGSASGWQPDELHETIHFALKQAERLEVAEAELARRDQAAGEPVGEIVNWIHPTEERKVDFRWLKYVPAGTKLYTTPPAPSAPDSWIKCSDRMPDGHGYYLTHSNAGVDVTLCQQGKFFHEYATHWMPLPPNPEE